MAALTQTMALKAPTAFSISSSRPSSLSVSRRSVSFPRRHVSLTISATAVDMDRLVADVKSLTLEQARILTDRLQEELGVSAAAMMPMGGGVAAPAAAEAAPVVEEKTEFDLFLDEVPSSSRIAVIKVVRALTGLGLKEAKDMIEGLPKKVKEAVAKEDADEGVKQLEAAGAKCSVK